MDIIAEIAKLYIRVLLRCSFGEDLSNREIEYYIKGQKTIQKVDFALREVWHNCIERLVSPQVVLFPNSASYHISSFDRENKRNIYAIRKLIHEIVDKRREDMKK